MSLCLISYALHYEDVLRNWVTAPTFLTFTLHGGEWPASHPVCFTLKEGVLSTHWVGSWRPPEPICTLERKNLACPGQELIHSNTTHRGIPTCPRHEHRLWMLENRLLRSISGSAYGRINWISEIVSDYQEILGWSNQKVWDGQYMKKSLMQSSCVFRYIRLSNVARVSGPYLVNYQDLVISETISSWNIIPFHQLAWLTTWDNLTLAIVKVYLTGTG